MTKDSRRQIDGAFLRPSCDNVRRTRSPVSEAMPVAYLDTSNTGRFLVGASSDPWKQPTMHLQGCGPVRTSL